MTLDVAWARIDGFEKYLVSSQGFVKNLRLGRQLSRQVNSGGIHLVSMMKDEGGLTTRSVAKLVADAFLPTHQNRHFTTVIHKDGRYENCDVDNLAWRSRPFAVRYHRRFRPPYFRKMFDKEIVCIETGDIFHSVSEAAIFGGVFEDELMNHCNLEGGDTCFPSGLTFRYV